MAFAGERTYATMLARHNTTFPGYMAELEGLADGAGVAFDHIFMNNVRESMGTVADPWPMPKSPYNKTERTDHCSHYVMFP